MGFLKTRPSLIEGLINRNLGKSINTTMEHLQTKQQGLQSTRKKTQDTYLKDTCKTNVVFFPTVNPSTTKEGKIYSDLCVRLPFPPNKVNKYIYVIYVYHFNSILKTVIKNRSEKEMIRAFKYLTTDFKNHGIDPGFHGQQIIKIIKNIHVNHRYQLPVVTTK